MSLAMLDKKLRSEDLFGSLQPEEEQKYRSAEVDDAMQKGLIRGLESVLEIPYPVFNSYAYRGDIRDWDPRKIVYGICLEHSLDGCSASDISNFVISLESYEKLLSRKKIRTGRKGIMSQEKYSEQIGLYVSSLINNSRDNEFTLHTKHIEGKIDSIGYKNNGKKITIEGSVGNCIGEGMEDGEILVNGSVSDHVGIRMSGGSIKVRKNASQRPGQLMKNGEIYIFGITGSESGFMMNGGLLYIEKGTFFGSHLGSGMEGGKICVASDIYDKGVGQGMSGGEIRIDGSVHGNDLGNRMKGGLICIDGNVKGAVGKNMSGGEIRVNGKYFPVAKSMSGGDIYRKGKLIVKNGEKVK